MKQSNKQLNKIYKELDKIFGEKAIMKIKSHIYSLWRKIEDLETSREMWKNRYYKLKKK